MRVLHVSAYFAPAFCYGGPPRSVFALCRSLQEQGVDVEVLTTTANGPDDLMASPPGGEAYDGVPVRYLPRAFPRRFFGAAGLKSALNGAFGRCDLVHVHGLWNVPANAAATAARRRGVPYIISPRGMLQPETIARGRLRKKMAYCLIERRNLAAAAALHATSSDEATTLRRLGLGVPVLMTPNGVDEPEQVSLPVTFRREQAIPERAPLVVFLGRIHPVKRIDLLITAFARVSTAFPDARLIVAGPDELGHAAELRRRCGPELNRIVWTGHLGPQEKWRLLSEASVVVMCSDSESFGLSLAEAMSAGVPVVVTKTCPWQEVEDYRAGLRVEQTMETVATALQTILSNPVAAREMGANGRDLVKSRYAWRSIAETMATHYHEVLSRHGKNHCRSAAIAAGAR